MMTLMMRINNEDTDSFYCTLLSLSKTNVISELFVFCGKDDALDRNAVSRIVGDAKCIIVYLDLESTEELFSERKCVLIYMALTVKKLSNSDRVLYVSNDSIICGDISRLYNKGFGEKSIIARAQSIEGVKRVGVVAEKGQLFDARVLLFNLGDINTDQFKRNALQHINVKNEQGLLNAMFEDDVMLVYDLEFNFRYSIYSMAEKNGIRISDIIPLITSFERKDYYFSNHEARPDQFALSEKAIKYGIDNGVILVPFNRRETFCASCRIVDSWMKLLSEINSEKANKIYDMSYRFIYDDSKKNKSLISVLDRIKNDDMVYESDLRKVTYFWLNRYIDTFDRSEAICYLKKIQSISIALKQNKVIKIGYFVYSSSEWQCEQLYKKINDNKSFENHIFIVSLDMGNEQIMDKTVQNTYDYFKNRKNVTNLYLYNGVNDLVEDMDVIVYFSPFDCVPDTINIGRRNITQLCIHIPYGFDIENKDDVRYGDTLYDRLFYRMLWRYYVYCEMNMKYASSRQRFDGYNIRFSGMPKIDDLLEKSYTKRKGVWKETRDTKLKIIWAPHFNMAEGMNGTFHENYLWFLDYAKKNKEVSWIVKPHPRMRMGVMESEVFNDISEYDKYIEEWKKLENANVIEYGDYYEVFDTSDAMILDSLSFIIEYLYTGKPQLLLLPNKPRELGGIGVEAVNILYKTRANDYRAIEQFIDDCINGKDELFTKRKEFVKNELDYNYLNGVSATSYIYNELKTISTMPLE